MALNFMSPETPVVLPPYGPDIAAVKDTQHRPIPLNFDDLLALRREEPARDEHIYNNPDMTIEEMSVSGADGPLPAIVLKSKS